MAVEKSRIRCETGKTNSVNKKRSQTPFIERWQEPIRASMITSSDKGIDPGKKKTWIRRVFEKSQGSRHEQQGSFAARRNEDSVFV